MEEFNIDNLIEINDNVIPGIIEIEEQDSSGIVYTETQYISNVALLLAGTNNNPEVKYNYWQSYKSLLDKNVIENRDKLLIPIANILKNYYKLGDNYRLFEDKINMPILDSELEFNYNPADKLKIYVPQSSYYFPRILSAQKNSDINSRIVELYNIMRPYTDDYYSELCGYDYKINKPGYREIARSNFLVSQYPDIASFAGKISDTTHTSSHIEYMNMIGQIKYPTFNGDKYVIYDGDRFKIVGYLSRKIKDGERYQIFDLNKYFADIEKLEIGYKISVVFNNSPNDTVHPGIVANIKDGNITIKLNRAIKLDSDSATDTIIYNAKSRLYHGYYIYIESPYYYHKSHIINNKFAIVYILPDYDTDMSRDDINKYIDFILPTNKELIEYADDIKNIDDIYKLYKQFYYDPNNIDTSLLDIYNLRIEKNIINADNARIKTVKKLEIDAPYAVNLNNYSDFIEKQLKNFDKIIATIDNKAIKAQHERFLKELEKIDGKIRDMDGAKAGKFCRSLSIGKIFYNKTELMRYSTKEFKDRELAMLIDNTSQYGILYYVNGGKWEKGQYVPTAELRKLKQCESSGKYYFDNDYKNECIYVSHEELCRDKERIGLQYQSNKLIRMIAVCEELVKFYKTYHKDKDEYLEINMRLSRLLDINTDKRFNLSYYRDSITYTPVDYNDGDSDDEIDIVGDSEELDLSGTDFNNTYNFAQSIEFSSDTPTTYTFADYDNMRNNKRRYYDIMRKIIAESGVDINADIQIYICNMTEDIINNVTRLVEIELYKKSNARTVGNKSSAEIAKLIYNSATPAGRLQFNKDIYNTIAALIIICIHMIYNPSSENNNSGYRITVNRNYIKYFNIRGYPLDMRTDAENVRQLVYYITASALVDKGSVDDISKSARKLMLLIGQILNKRKDFKQRIDNNRASIRELEKSAEELEKYFKRLNKWVGFKPELNYTDEPTNRIGKYLYNIALFLSKQERNNKSAIVNGCCKEKLDADYDYYNIFPPIIRVPEFKNELKIVKTHDIFYSIITPRYYTYFSNDKLYSDTKLFKKSEIIPIYEAALLKLDNQIPRYYDYITNIKEAIYVDDHLISYDTQIAKIDKSLDFSSYVQQLYNRLADYVLDKDMKSRMDKYFINIGDENSEYILNYKMLSQLYIHNKLSTKIAQNMYISRYIIFPEYFRDLTNSSDIIDKILNIVANDKGNTDLFSGYSMDDKQDILYQISMNLNNINVSENIAYSKINPILLITSLINYILLFQITYIFAIFIMDIDIPDISSLSRAKGGTEFDIMSIFDQIDNYSGNKTQSALQNSIKSAGDFIRNIFNDFSQYIDNNNTNIDDIRNNVGKSREANKARQMKVFDGLSNDQKIIMRQLKELGLVDLNDPRYVSENITAELDEREDIENSADITGTATISDEDAEIDADIVEYGGEGNDGDFDDDYGERDVSWGADVDD